MIRIRNFRPADTEKILEFKEKSVKLNFPGTDFDRKMFRKILLRSSKRNPDYIKVAEDDGKIAGYVWFKTVDSAVGEFGRIEHIFVDPSFRRSGLGKKLMEASEVCMKAEGMKRVKLTVTCKNEAAVSLYEKMGYRTERFVMERDL